MITKDKLEKLACIYIDLLGYELSHSSREQVVFLGGKDKSILVWKV